MSEKESLLRHTQRRVFVTGIISAAILATLAWVGWDAALDAYANRLAEEIRQHYTLKLTQDRQVWQQQAERLRAQIEFMRLGELPSEERREHLRAFFTAQGEYQDFAAVLVAHANGQPILTIGCYTLLLKGLSLIRAKRPNRHVKGDCPGEEAVYWLTHTPLWLGKEGKGLALFGTALDHSYLTRLAKGRDHLYLLHGGRIITATGSIDHGLLVSLGEVPKRTDSSLLIALPIDSNKHMDGSVLVVHHTLDPLLPMRAVLATVGVSALAIFLLISLVLGNSLRQHLLRLAALAKGARAFTTRFTRDDTWRQSLHLAQLRTDEISRLAVTLDRLMQVAETRQREQLIYRQTLDLLDEVVVELDLTGRVLCASSAWARVCGSDGDIVGKRLTDLLDPDDVPSFEVMLRRLSVNDKLQASTRLRLITGQVVRWLEIRLVRSPESRNLRGVLRDVTQSYLQEQRITHMALHDALTELPNRVLLEDRLRVALRLAARNQSKVALGFLDLDHFKHVNDNLGHKTGDALLKALAQRLRANLRVGDTLARWGGDEFVVLLPQIPSYTAAQNAAAKLKAAVESPIEVEGQEFHLTFSAGFALYPDDATQPEQLLAHADQAMFYAKAQGRNALCFFAEMAQKGPSKNEIQLQQRLAAAVREARIVNHYQPLVDAKSRRVIGVECLARWTDPDLGPISPATFIPMAESLGIIRELGQLVWHRALADARQWRDIGLDLRLAVNLSKRQLFKPNFTEELLANVLAEGLSPQSITLEITESTALLDIESATDRLAELKAAGFRLAIDDFGTGYSSLSQLHEISADELKIDISFVRRIDKPDGERLIQTIVGLAASLGLKTVAEGVEDAHVADKLTDMGVDTLQGWYCGRPMPPEAVVDWVRQWPQQSEKQGVR